MNVILSTGGTGGHIFTGIAIAERLKKYGIKVIIVGSKFGMERKLLKEAIKPDYYLLTTKYRRSIKFIFFLIISFLQSIFIIIKEKPDAVIGTGSYASFSISFIASILSIPTFITEIDAIPGKATKVLSKFVYEIWLAYDSAKNYLPKKKTIVAGFFVREQITSKKINYELPPTILVIGGSQGAKFINKIMKEVIPTLPQYKFIWQTGDDSVLEEFSNAKIYKFIENIGASYNEAKLIISRSGALTIGEIIKVGLPSILIPYPYAASGHQYINAKILEKKGAAKVMRQENITTKKMVEEIKNIMENKEIYEKMSNAVKSLYKGDASEKLVKRILELTRHNV